MRTTFVSFVTLVFASGLVAAQNPNPWCNGDESNLASGSYGSAQGCQCFVKTTYEGEGCYSMLGYDYSYGSTIQAPLDWNAYDGVHLNFYDVNPSISPDCSNLSDELTYCGSLQPQVAPQQSPPWAAPTTAHSSPVPTKTGKPGKPPKGKPHPKKCNCPPKSKPGSKLKDQWHYGPDNHLVCSYEHTASHVTCAYDAWGKLIHKGKSVVCQPYAKCH